jgi:hypothetical protein
MLPKRWEGFEEKLWLARAVIIIPRGNQDSQRENWLDEQK